MMVKGQILVVEDNSIVVMEIRDRLESLGHAVCATASSGEEAIRKAGETHPDLVVMDIRLKGDMDGVEAAQEIHARFDIPVIYLTAYADNDTLQRAKITEPFGYIIKPFEEIQLHSTIEMALHKHHMERKLRETERWLATTLASVGDAVIATDEKGLVSFLNAVAEALTSWKRQDALGKDLAKVCNIIDEETRSPIESPVTRAPREGTVVNQVNHTVLLAKDGREIPIDYTAAPIKDDKGGIVSVHVDEKLNMRDLEVGPENQAQVRALSYTFNIAPLFVDGPRSFSRAEQPGNHDLYVSVGLRDGTPKIALPHEEDDGQRRYKLGKIEVLERA